MRRTPAVFIELSAAVILLGAAGPSPASPPAEEPQPKTRRVVVGQRFRAGGLHRFLLGRDYRDLWTMPVELPVLDLATYAGGLRPQGRVGHGQTKALALEGADGKNYTFRPVLKDPSGLLPDELQATLASAVAKDQMASGHPAGHVVVPAILDAVGILHNVPRLVVMPDDPALSRPIHKYSDVLLVDFVQAWMLPSPQGGVVCPGGALFSSHSPPRRSHAWRLPRVDIRHRIVT